VSVTFSAFDPFEPISRPRNRTRGMAYTYIGLKKIKERASDETLPPKDLKAIAQEFAKSVSASMGNQARLARWLRMLGTLEADPVFHDARVSSLAAYAHDRRR